jgi:hypothetical protein
MAVGRSQIWAVRWMRQDSPLKLSDGLSDTQIGVWPHIVVVKKHFYHIFMGTNPPETLLQNFVCQVSGEYQSALVESYKEHHIYAKVSPYEKLVCGIKYIGYRMLAYKS